MVFFEGLDPVVVQYIIIPLMIFFARLIDVSLGTLRILFITRGEKVIAPILGFLEVLIWVIAIGQVMQNLTNFATYLAWAGGFAVGNYIGLLIEEKLAIGLRVVRIITAKDASTLSEVMKRAGFRITMVDAEGNEGKVNLLFTIIQRKDLDRALTIIKKYNPNAFYSVEDVRSVHDAEFLPSSNKMLTMKNFFYLKKSR